MTRPTMFAVFSRLRGSAEWRLIEAFPGESEAERWIRQRIPDGATPRQEFAIAPVSMPAEPRGSLESFPRSCETDSGSAAHS